MIANKRYARYAATVNGWSARALARIKHKSIKKGMPYDLDLEWYREKLLAMKCEATGIGFTDGYWLEGAITPHTPSIDKIDPSLGYVKSNCQVVVWIYNVAKQNFTHENVLYLAASLNKYKGTHKEI